MQLTTDTDETFFLDRARTANERNPSYVAYTPQRMQYDHHITINPRRPSRNQLQYIADQARSGLGEHNTYTGAGPGARKKQTYRQSINNPTLYAKAKRIADRTYKKPSAYKSGFIVKTYQELGGTYNNTSNPKTLKRWFKEKWADIGHKSYPVYRPTKRVNKYTPLTASEIDPVQARKQIRLKQKIRGESNLPRFVRA